MTTHIQLAVLVLWPFVSYNDTHHVVVVVLQLSVSCDNTHKFYDRRAPAIFK